MRHKGSSVASVLFTKRRIYNAERKSRTYIRLRKFIAPSRAFMRIKCNQTTAKIRLDYICALHSRTCHLHRGWVILYTHEARDSVGRLPALYILCVLHYMRCSVNRAFLYSCVYIKSNPTSIGFHILCE